MDRNFWSPIVDRFITDLRNFNFLGRNLDVRENLRFRGGNFPRWIHENFPKKGCALAIEFKKFFMDEWTGIPDNTQLKAIGNALQSTIPGILEELEKF
jgi:N-formylglutamate deformylase